MLHGQCTCPLLIRSNSPISPGGAGDGYKGAGRVSGMGLTPGTDLPLSLRGLGGGDMGREEGESGERLHVDLWEVYVIKVTDSQISYKCAL